jgi:hypothetical protein
LRIKEAFDAYSPLSIQGPLHALTAACNHRLQRAKELIRLRVHTSQLQIPLHIHFLPSDTDVGSGYAAGVKGESSRGTAMAAMASLPSREPRQLLQARDSIDARLGKAILDASAARQIKTLPPERAAGTLGDFRRSTREDARERQAEERRLHGFWSYFRAVCCCLPCFNVEQGLTLYDFGSQGCRFEPCRVQIKFQS